MAPEIANTDVAILLSLSDTTAGLVDDETYNSSWLHPSHRVGALTHAVGLATINQYTPHRTKYAQMGHRTSISCCSRLMPSTRQRAMTCSVHTAGQQQSICECQQSRLSHCAVMEVSGWKGVECLSALGFPPAVSVT